MKYIKVREEIKVVNDQVGSPTNAEDLVYHMLNIALTEEYGIYNCVNKGQCTRYDLERKIVELAGYTV